MKKCVFAGTFDPITKGHEEIIKKAAELFDEVYVVLSVNPEKKTLFSERDRLEFLTAVAEKYGNVKIAVHHGLLVDFMRKNGIKYTVRGLRNQTDFEYEACMDYFNSRLDGEIVSVFLPCPAALVHVSSSAVRELISLGLSINDYVPTEVSDLIKKRVEEKGTKKD